MDAVKSYLAEQKDLVEQELTKVLKPYNESAENIRLFIGKKVKAILFYEEEIKSGGMGMNLAEILSDEFVSQNIKFDILAIDDNFASTSSEGQNAFQMAGVDCVCAENTIKRIMNNV